MFFSSTRTLRRSVRIVNKHLKLGTYYLDVCERPIDYEFWYLKEEDIIKLKIESAQKVLEHCEKYETEIKETISYIEEVEKGFYYQKIYQSANWSYAYSLLKTYLKQIIQPQIRIANKCIEEYGSYES